MRRVARMIMSYVSTQLGNPSIKGALLIVAGLFVGLYLHSEFTRYSLQGAGSYIYKLDRRTGRLWLVTDRQVIPIEENESTPEQQVIDLVKVPKEPAEMDSVKSTPEQQAIELVKEFDYYFAGLYTTGLSIDKAVKMAMTENGADYVAGWNAQKLDDQNYLVSYGYKEGHKEYFYCFKANLIGDFVVSLSEENKKWLERNGISNIISLDDSGIIMTFLEQLRYQPTLRANQESNEEDQ